MKLVIGNKAYSSWSFRPWILLKVLGIPFDEELIPLYREGSAEAIRKLSPGGKVPALIDGDIVVWESLSIIEYIADRFPAAASGRPIPPPAPMPAPSPARCIRASRPCATAAR